MSTQSQMIRVSRVKRHSSNHSIHRSSVKTRRSRKIIHISIRPINNESSTARTKRPISTAGIQLKQQSPDTQSSTNKRISPTNLSEHQGANDKTHLSIKTNGVDVTQNHHRKKKKKNNFRRICLCVSLLITSLCIITAIILAVLLSKKSTTKVVTRPVVVTLRWNSSGITIAGQTNANGTSSCQLKWPYGLAFDSSNTLYIADYLNNRIQKLIKDTSMCVTVAGQTNGSIGNSINQLNQPTDILFDSNDNMYIVDRGNNRIQFWLKGASSGTTIASNTTTPNFPFFAPTGIVSGSTSNIFYISDTYNHRILSYPSSSIVAGGYGPGNNVTQLYYPFGLVYDKISQNFIISNYATNNIVRWAVGGITRTHLIGNINGVSGFTSSELNSPVGLTMDPMSNIYIADSGDHRIQFFLNGESNGTTIAGTTGLSGTNSNQLNSPLWIALDNQLNLYVSDAFNNRVQKFLRY